jgi:hypothetical protein
MFRDFRELKRQLVRVGVKVYPCVSLRRGGQGRVILGEAEDAIDREGREEKKIPPLRWEGAVGEALTLVGGLPDSVGPDSPGTTDHYKDFRRFWARSSRPSLRMRCFPRAPKVRVRRMPARSQPTARMVP